jgi:predicted dehydrogenase
MNALILGLGSIGQRWARLLNDFGDFALYTHRRGRIDITISSDLQSSYLIPPEKSYSITNLDSVEALRAIDFDATFICSPISVHVDDLVLALGLKSKKILIEKPIAHRFSINEKLFLEELVNKLKSNDKMPQLMVGYQSRFHPAINRIKELLVDGLISQVNYVSTEFGEWLPGMHPYEDYRNSHMAKFDLGGGPATCLSHDLDLIESIFGKIKKHTGSNFKFQTLITDVPDLVSISWEIESKEFGEIKGQSRMDFISWPPTRKIEIIGSRGKIIFNWLEGELQVYSQAKGYLLESFNDLSRDDIFEMELEYLIDEDFKTDFQALESAIRVTDIAASYSVRY